MTTVVVAAIQAVSQAGSFQERWGGVDLPHALGLLDQAAALDANIACFPELFPLAGGRELCAKARELGIYVIAGLAEGERGRWYNTGTVISRQGQVVGRQRKNFPTSIELNNGVIPADGYQVFDTEVGRLGIVICSDFAFFTKGVEQLKAQGVDIVFNPALWFALSEAFPATVIGRHMEYSVPVVGVNIAKAPSPRVEPGGEQAFPPAGGYSTICVSPQVTKLDDLAEWFRTKPGGINSTEGFVYTLGEEEGILTAEIDIEAVRAFPGYFYYEGP